RAATDIPARLRIVPGLGDLRGRFRWLPGPSDHRHLTTIERTCIRSWTTRRKRHGNPGNTGLPGGRPARPGDPQGHTGQVQHSAPARALAAGATQRRFCGTLKVSQTARQTTLGSTPSARARSTVRPLSWSNTKSLATLWA